MDNSNELLVLFYSEDRATLGKLVEAVKTNFNERGEEVISNNSKPI